MTLSKAWKEFLAIALYPWVVLLLLATIGLNVLLVRQTDASIIVALSVIVTLLSGVLGGVATKRWLDASEEKVIVARGKTAVRGLKLLLGSIVSLEKRVRAYLTREHDRPEKEACDRELLLTEFEEVIGKCIRLEEEVISSIENWTDIVPESDIKTQIGEWTKLKLEVDKQKRTMLDLQKSLSETQNLSDAEKKELETKISEKENEICRLRKDLTSKEYSFASWPTTGFATDSGLPIETSALEYFGKDLPNYSSLEHLQFKPVSSKTSFFSHCLNPEKDEENEPNTLKQ